MYQRVDRCTQPLRVSNTSITFYHQKMVESSEVALIARNFDFHIFPNKIIHWTHKELIRSTLRTRFNISLIHFESYGKHICMQICMKMKICMRICLRLKIFAMNQRNHVESSTSIWLFLYAFSEYFFFFLRKCETQNFGRCEHACNKWINLSSQLVSILESMTWFSSESTSSLNVKFFGTVQFFEN